MLSTILKKDVGKISTGLEEGFILPTRSVRSCIAPSKTDGQDGQSEMEVKERITLVLTSLIFSTQMERKSLFNKKRKH